MRCSKLVLLLELWLLSFALWYFNTEEEKGYVPPAGCMPYLCKGSLTGLVNNNYLKELILRKHMIYVLMSVAI